MVRRSIAPSFKSAEAANAAPGATLSPKQGENGTKKNVRQRSIVLRLSTERAIVSIRTLSEPLPLFPPFAERKKAKTVEKVRRIATYQKDFCYTKGWERQHSRRFPILPDDEILF